MINYMSDLLSAASLILAVVGMLYSLWYPDIQKALSEDVPKFKDDRGKVHKLLSSALWTRSFPLSLLAIVVCLIFTPDTVKVFFRIYLQVTSQDLTTFFENYDSVGIAFLFVEILTLAIGIHLFVLSIRLIKLRYFQK